MNLSYYTVDDLRLGHDPKGVVGWRMSHFLSLDDALTHYASLPATGVKSLGLTDGVHCLEIARCVPLFEYDREGEDILASDYVAIFEGTPLEPILPTEDESTGARPV